MPRQKNRILAAGLLLVLVTACSSQKAAEPGAGGAPAGGGGGGGRGGRGGGGPVPVITGHVEKKAVPVTIPAVGTAEALQTVQVRAQVTGQLSGIHFSEGQEVHKGQLLFTIDPRPFQAALEQAQAVLARDTATAKNSQSQQARYEDLFKRGLIPRDQYETQMATASAQQATLAADQAAVDTAQLNLQYTSISAPIAGRAGALTVHQGDLVRQNDTTPLLVINQMAPIYVGFSVPGRFLTDIRRFQAQRPLKVQARLQGSPTGPTQLAVGTPNGRPGDTPAAGGAPGSRGRSGARRGCGQLHRQCGRSDDRHNQAEGDLPEHQPRAVAGPVRAGHIIAHDRSGCPGRAGHGGPGIAAGHVRIRRESGSHGRDAERAGRPPAGGRDRYCTRRDRR